MMNSPVRGELVELSNPGTSGFWNGFITDDIYLHLRDDEKADNPQAAKIGWCIHHTAITVYNVGPFCRYANSFFKGFLESNKLFCISSI